MGSSASVQEDKLNQDLRDALDAIEARKLTILEYDVALLDRESSKVFKQHDKIISSLTGRSKAQLRKINAVSKYGSPDHIYKLIGGSNNYSRFMKMIFMNKQDIEMENIQASSAYDEELLVNIIGTSTLKEIKQLDEKFTELKKTSLLELFESKIKEGNPLLKLLQKIFQYSRDESKQVDPELTASLASDIHKAGAAKLMGVDDEVIFDIICKYSRGQCAAAADSYMAQFNIKFERAINMKFKGNCAKLILLWTQLPPTAVTNLLNAFQERMIIDKYAIISFIAKYDKDFLTHAEVACEKYYDKHLDQLVKRALSGSLADAVQGWIHNATPDKGYERVLDLYVESQVDQGRDVDELLKGDEFQSRLLFIVKKQLSELDKYMKENKIKFAGDQYSIDSLTSMKSQVGMLKSQQSSFFSEAGSLRSQKSTSSLTTPPVVSPSKQSKPEETKPVEAKIVDYVDSDQEDTFDDEPMALPTPAVTVVASTKINKFTLRSNQSFIASNQSFVEGYLNSFFTRHDPDELLFFKADDFWSLLTKLPYTKFGLTREELLAVREFSEWENDGLVYYFEALPELTDTIITAIEHKSEGDNNVRSVIAECLKEQSQKPIGDSSSSSVIEKTTTKNLSVTATAAAAASKSSVPEYFLTYLYDTFEAFDYDNNGYLTQDELTELIPAMNIDLLSMSDFIDDEVSACSIVRALSIDVFIAMFIHTYMHACFQGGRIVFRDAVKVVSKVVEAYFNDRVNDHYVSQSANSMNSTHHLVVEGLLTFYYGAVCCVDLLGGQGLWAVLLVQHAG